VSKANGRTLTQIDHTHFTQELPYPRVGGGRNSDFASEVGARDERVGAKRNERLIVDSLDEGAPATVLCKEAQRAEGPTPG
jgi:hypothetical protein